MAFQVFEVHLNFMVDWYLMPRIGRRCYKYPPKYFAKIYSYKGYNMWATFW